MKDPRALVERFLIANSLKMRMLVVSERSCKMMMTEASSSGRLLLETQ